MERQAVFVQQLANLITMAVAHMSELQDPPICDCSPLSAGSRGFRQELEDYSREMEGVLTEAFEVLRVRAVDFQGAPTVVAVGGVH